MATAEESEISLFLTKCNLAAENYASVCPAISRFFMIEASQIQTGLGYETKISSEICPHCCTIWRPGTVERKLLPRVRLNKKIKRLMKKSESGQRLGKLQQKILSNYKNGKNRLSFKCKVCNKKTSIPGAKLLKKTKSSKKESNRALKRNQKLLNAEKVKTKTKPKKKSLLDCLMTDLYNFKAATGSK